MRRTAVAATLVVFVGACAAARETSAASATSKSAASATPSGAASAIKKSATTRTQSSAKKQTPGRVLAGKVTVIDGDGLEISGTRVRLFGVDAPEADQYCNRGDGTRWRCGHYATVALDRLTAGKKVVCTSRKKDRYSRAIATCTVDGRDVAADLAHQGWVLAYRHYSMDYVDEEDAAKKQRAGVWAGEIEAPWDYRHRRHATEKYDR